MKLEFLVVINCHGGTCPTIYHSDRGTFVVQGNLMDAQDISELSIPSHEGVVEVPEALVRALAEKLNAK